MILEGTSLSAFVFTLLAAERIRSGMDKNVLFQITSCCERELTLRASERLLTRMYQYVCLEGTSLCAFVFALIAAERLFSSMNTHMLFQISIKNGGVETHGASVGFLSSLLYFGLGCETHCSKNEIFLEINLPSFCQFRLPCIRDAG